MRILLPIQKPYNAFYMGYAFALFHRMLDYRLVNYKIMLVFNVISIIVKFSAIMIPEVIIGTLVVMLEILPMILSFKGEKIDRRLFHTVYKSRSQLIKFKRFMTENLPNQIVILAKDYASSHFINDSFQKSFQCKNIIQIKKTFQNLVIEPEDIRKNENLL